MELVSTREPVRFVPSDQADRPEEEQVAYLIKPPSIYERPRFRRACLEHGARFHTDVELVACLREGVAALLPGEADAIRRTDLLETVDAFAAARIAGDVDPELAVRMEAIEEIVTGGYEPYAQKVASRGHFVDIAPIEAFRLFVVGWENLDLPFSRSRTGIPLAVLERVPEAHVYEAGLKAFELISLPEDEEKKSPSPSPGASGPRTSPTASATPPTIPPPPKTSGRSRKSASSG